ncbi:MAG: AsmA family protein [Acidobacteria bacterium]|nr:MAG: AsmA family protein [Acidobacteriota bacterium]
MNQTRRRNLRNAAAALALLIVAAWVAPLFLNAGRYRPLLKAGLEHSLGRKVALGHIALHFFPRLGFTVDDVVVDEDPAFGLEPFVRVGRIDCDLRWRSLWSSHLYLGTLKLSSPSINIVRNSSGRWNIEDLLLRSEIKSPPSGPATPALAPASLAVEIEEARLNFKIGENKKPFAIIGTRAHLDFDYDSDRVNFRMAGEPVRTDLEFPTPGLVELDGSWSPARDAGHSLDATLRMQGTLLYDWIPLLTGKNPEVYGVMNSTIHLGGNLRQIVYTGEAQVSQLHRWEQLPSSSDLPCDLRFRGQFDRDKADLAIKGMDVAFGDSQLHLEGSVANVASRPDLDLVVAFERSQLEDLLRLGVRVLGKRVSWDVNGRLNGMITVQGHWNGKRYGGFLNAHQVRLDTSSGAFPVSDIAIRINQLGVRLSPAKVMLAPGVEVVVEGALRHLSPRQSSRPVAVHPSYQLTLSSSSVNLGKLVHFGRALGILSASPMEAEGIGSFTLRLAGGAWPWSKPSVTAQASIRSARLVVPGLSEPLNVPRARIQVYGKQVIINPILAVMGTSLFSGWVMQQRGSNAPWDFSLKADKLSIEQAGLWFEGIGDRNTSSFLDRISGLATLISGRRPSFHPVESLDAHGRFSTPLMTYRGLSLRDFQSSVDIRDRKLRLSKVRFDAGGGHGEASALVDLSKSPAWVSGQVGIRAASIQPLAPYLPPALGKARGFYSASGNFAASGLTHAEFAHTLKGNAIVELESVNLGDFNPVGAMVRRLGMELFEGAPQMLFIPGATAHLHIQNRLVTLEEFPVDVAGAEFQISGGYSFDGSARLLVRADLRGIHHPWTPVHPGITGPVSRMADLRFAGTLHNLEMVPSAQISQTQP